MREEKAKIFLSYAHIDLGIAKEIYNDLKRFNLDIWFDKESLLPGQTWEKEIEKAIRESDFFIALLSSRSVSKMGFVHSELRLSFEIVDKYCPASKVFIIPVRLDDCNPSDADEKLGKIHWIDLFPEGKYEEGIKKILEVVSPGTFILRNQSKELSQVDVNNTIIKHGFFDKYINPTGRGVSHEYEKKEIENNTIIFDKVTSLMWQQGGSSNDMPYEKAKKWIEELNLKGYADYRDWRLPTLEEAMSLMESQMNKAGLYIDPIFNTKQRCIWTSDLFKGEPRLAWIVYFGNGSCLNLFYDYYYVRAVRSGQLSVK